MRTQGTSEMQQQSSGGSWFIADSDMTFLHSAQSSKHSFLSSLQPYNIGYVFISSICIPPFVDKCPRSSQQPDKIQIQRFC